MVVSLQPLLSTRLDPASLNKPAKDSPSKAQATTRPTRRDTIDSLAPVQQPTGGPLAWPSVPTQQSVASNALTPQQLPLHLTTGPALIPATPASPAQALDSPHLPSSANRVADTSENPTTFQARRVELQSPTLSPALIDTAPKRPRIKLVTSQPTRQTRASSRFSFSYVVPPVDSERTVDSILVTDPQPLLRCTTKMLTYSEYFRATPSPFGSAGERNMAYATIFSYFTLASPPPQVLLGHLLNLFESEAVGALGIFVADSQGLPCLRLVHGLRKYPGPLTQHSPNKNKAFGYLDDNEGEAGELVLVDESMLSPTTASRVLTLDHHLAEREAHPTRLSIPVIPEGTAHSELIKAHKAFFIPFELPSHGGPPPSAQ
eukprot:jgi/Psemu1/61121/gm1.61121_g